MSYDNWKDKVGTFEVMDVRGKKMDFFPALKAKAAALKKMAAKGCISSRRWGLFPCTRCWPLWALSVPRKVSGSEYHVCFYRVRKGE